MLSKTKFVLAAALVLGVPLPASAATEQHRSSHAHAAINSTVPDISDSCLPAGPPCRTEPDGW
jgi:hypothetical protein